MKVNPIIFFDVNIGKNKVGRIKIQLFADRVPKAAENFRQLCTGQHLIHSKPIGYKDTAFYKIKNDCLIEGGDFLFNDGTGSCSIYGHSFPVENYDIKHNEAGLVSMVSYGSDSIDCKFQIQTQPCEWLNKKSMVVGKLLDQNSLKIVRSLITTPTNENGKAKTPIVIVECGQL